jgi:N-acetylmuramoyl-L-alanine amidase
MKRVLMVLLLMLSVSLLMFAQRQNLSGLTFCIDQGHGGYNSNDRNVIPDAGINFWESESNYFKGILLKRLLEARGAWVIVTRPNKDSTYANTADNDEPTLTARWQLANANNVNWFHSIHSNATGGTNTSTNYTLVLLKENISTRQALFPEALKMSDAIYRRIRERNRTSAFGVALDYTFYGGPNGGYNLGVMSGLAMPGELSEGSFHDNYPETRRLMNNDYRKNEAYGILNGFLEYYGVPFDTLGVIAGTQVDKALANKPLDNIVVRLLPLNKVYNGDNYHNGFFFFDSLPSGNYSVLFQTPAYPLDTVKLPISSSRNPVSSTQPAANEMSVGRSKIISITFLNPIDTAKVRSAFSISPAVDGDIAWSDNNTVMTFTPKQLLGIKTTYTLTLAGMGNSPAPLAFVDNTTVTSSVGLAAFTSTFTTVTLPPFALLTQPLMNDTSFNAALAIGIRFSEIMDTASVRAAFSISPSVKGKIAWLNPNATLLFTPDSALPYNTNFTVTVGPTAKSFYGIFVDGNKDSVGGDPIILNFRTAKSSTGITEHNNFLPAEYQLAQNFPNPFNPKTDIQISLPHSSRTTLKIYDVLGREVATLLNDNLGAGRYTVSFDASSLPSGVYFYRIVASEFSAVKKMMLTK